MQASLDANWAVLLVIFSLGSLLSLLIVLTSRFHGTFSFDRRRSIQRAHDVPVPRIGGAAVLVAMVVGWSLMTDKAVTLWWCLPAIVVVIIGLAEDLTHATPVSVRLLGTMAAGAIFAIGTGYAVGSVDLILFDMALSYPLVAILFTGFATGGLCQAMNMIDGVHGLASGTALICLVGFATLAASVGDVPMVTLTLILAAAVAGFLVVNFPFGKVFLGDSGAYLLGFALAAVAVMLPARNVDISPWACLLVLGYPVVEALFSMFRRNVVAGRQVARADTGHLHSLVYRSWIGDGRRGTWLARHGNAATGLVMLIFSAIPVCLATLSPDSTAANMMLLAAFTAFYVVVYTAISQQGQASVRPRARMRTSPDI